MWQGDVSFATFSLKEMNLSLKMWQTKRPPATLSFATIKILPQQKGGVKNVDRPAAL